MQLTTFCTIITPPFLAFAKTLFHSLRSFNPSIRLVVFITEETSDSIIEGVKVLTPSMIKDASSFAALKKKYPNVLSDSYRWAMKPLLIKHLLESGYDKVIYTDPDIYFVSDYHFLEEQLNTASVLLSPHFNSIEMEELDNTMPAIFRGGLFNAGFVGASKNGLAAISWWLDACIHKIDCTKDSGYYDDQKYLDLLVVEFDNIEIIKHRGCNLACWNIKGSNRSLENGHLLINKKYIPVFIHFTKNTVEHILNGYDGHLNFYLQAYFDLLNKHGFNPHSFYPDHTKVNQLSLLKKIKHLTLIRTRCRNFLSYLAKKI
jgi:lipopolysaccharide biosynthesis glycosyltransferase